MPSFHHLVILLLLVIVTSSFILQDLPLERFERSDHGEELFAPKFGERHTRAGQLFRPGANFWARVRMMSG